MLFDESVPLEGSEKTDQKYGGECIDPEMIQGYNLKSASLTKAPRLIIRPASLIVSKLECRSDNIPIDPYAPRILSKVILEEKKNISSSINTMKSRSIKNFT